jgi:hypothetical protein
VTADSGARRDRSPDQPSSSGAIPAATDDPLDATHLYFGTDWEGENRTSAHHVARWLGGRAPMLYFECPGMRAPRSTGRDYRRIARKVALAFRPPRRPMPLVEVRTLLQLPFHRLPGVRTFNRLMLQRAVRRAVRRVTRGRKRPVVSWFLSPHIGDLAGRIGEDLAVQYCVDDYAAFPDVDVAAITAMDEALSRAADIVFVTSDTMLERKQRLARQVAVAPHGVDVAHFRQAADASLPVPPDVATLRGPVIGFFGLIEAWIDLDLVAGLAERHPEWSFVLIGRVAVPATALPRQSNIHFLGVRPYEQLPQYGRRFDVSIIPYRQTQQVHHANPIKLREYLAMEKPIVAVPTPEIAKFADVVTQASTLDEWDAAITAALANDDDAARSRRRAAADAMTWHARLIRIEGIVRDALAGRPFKPPAVTR